MEQSTEAETSASVCVYISVLVYVSSHLRLVLHLLL